MWPIFLKILSIIGIVLACILGVVILLLLLILLCPITYKIDGSAHDNKYKLSAKVKYLFGIVRAGYDYPEPGIIYAKALFFTLYDSSKSSDKDKDADESLDDESLESESLDDDSMDNELSNSASLDTKSLDNELSDSESADNKHIDKKHLSNKSSGKEENNSVSTKKSTNRKSKNKKKILNPMYYIKKTWENIRYKVIVKIQYIIKDIKYYIALWEHDDTQALVRSVKKHLFKILKIIAPKKGNIDLTFGTGAPDTTGQIYGVCCSLFTRWPKAFKFVPDFENKIIDGDVHIAGCFNLFSIAVHALPVVLSRKLKKTKDRFDTHSLKKDISIAKALKKHEKIIKELEEEYS